MLASINPLGERARGNRWWVTTGFYVVGSTLGGMAALGAVSALGRLVGWLGGARSLYALGGQGLAPATVAVACLVAAALEARVIPSLRRQVNEDWLAGYRGWVYGSGFGFQLGVGLATTVTTAAVYLMFILAFLGGSPTEGMWAGAAFGALRAVPVVGMWGADTPAKIRSVHANMAAGSSIARRLAIGALTVAALVSPLAVWA